VDNKNLVGSYMQRRRNIKTGNVYPLYSPIVNHRQLVLDKNPTKTYIDMNGYIFKYVKSRFVPLKYYYICHKEFYNNSIIYSLTGLFCKFIVKSTESSIEAKYLGLLSIDGGYMIYDLAKNRKKNTRVKI
jgi:hypothetical protein